MERILPPRAQELLSVLGLTVALGIPFICLLLQPRVSSSQSIPLYITFLIQQLEHTPELVEKGVNHASPMV